MRHVENIKEFSISATSSISDLEEIPSQKIAWNSPLKDEKILSLQQETCLLVENITFQVTSTNE